MKFRIVDRFIGGNSSLVVDVKMGKESFYDIELCRSSWTEHPASKLSGYPQLKLRFEGGTVRASTGVGISIDASRNALDLAKNVRIRRPGHRPGSVDLLSTRHQLAFVLLRVLGQSLGGGQFIRSDNPRHMRGVDRPYERCPPRQ